MRHARPAERWPCYAIGFRDDAALDGSPADLPYARLAASHLGVALESIEVEPAIIDRLDRMLFHLDEPQADPAPINALLIAERARAQGVTVLLSGAGGDDIFSGYRRHQLLGADRVLQRAPRALRALVAQPARALAGNGWSAQTTVSRRVTKALEHFDLSDDRRTISHFWWSGEALRRGLYSPELRETLRDVDTAAPMLETLQLLPADTHPLDRMLHLETTHFLADHNLNYTDKMGMAAGVEVRVPLLDLELVRFAARIPPHMKQRRFATKAILRKAMRDELPPAILHRRKTGFGVPLRRWLQQELRERVDETLSPARIEARGLFDPRAVRALIDADRARRVDGAYTIFALMCIELWCGIFIDPLRPSLT